MFGLDKEKGGTLEHQISLVLSKTSLTDAATVER